MAFLGAIGSIVGGVIGFAQASYQAQVAKMNEEIAKDNAARAIVTSQVNEQSQDAQTAAMLGTQESLQAASGLSLNSATSRRIRRSSRILGRLDTLNVRQGAEIDKYNYLTQAANFKAEAANAKIGGIGSLLGGFINAGAGMVGNTSIIGASRSTASPFVPKPLPKPTVYA